MLLWFNMPAALPHHARNPRGCQTTAALFWVARRQFAPLKSDWARRPTPQFVHKQCNWTEYKCFFVIREGKGGAGGVGEEMHSPARVWDVFTHVRSRRDQTHCNLEMCHSERGECVRERVYFFFSFLLSFLHAFGRRRTGAVTREPRNHKGKHKKNSFPLAAFTGDRACSLSLR